jgi:tetratricopeptide (TPR) repeat protein
MTPPSTVRRTTSPTDTPPPLRTGVQDLIPTARLGTVPLDLPLATPDVVPMIGRYELGPLLGEGGMGAVYLATQTEPVRRSVAIKLIREGAADRDAVARFEAERQALALMDHPHVARIYDGGTTPDGRPYFVMEYVDGIPMTAFCDRQRLGVRERIDLFLAVCSAVQHAHQKGILHRDLKPGNILVETPDGVAVPKVIDFGLVKALDATAVGKPDVTRVGQVMGTPAYMAPEQADVGRVDTDTRADVYALGVILFELLTGSTPLPWSSLRDQSFSEQLRLVREAETPRPSERIAELRTPPELIAARGCERARLRELVRGDLDWIVTKALEKDRNARYESAAALADDLRRHLTHEPVSAGPPSRMYRARKFVLRNRGLVLAGSLVAASLVGGVIGTSAGMARARAAEAVAKHDRDAAREARRDEETQRWIAERATVAAKDGERKARESDAEARAVITFFQEKVLTAARPTWFAGGLGTRATIRDALAAAEPGLATAFAGQPRAEGAIRDVLGKTYRTLGDYDRSVALHERARDLLLATIGPDHAETWSCLNNLAVSLIESGRAGEALPLLETVVTNRAGRFGPAHEDTLDARNNLASAKRSLGRTEEALEGFATLETDCRATLGPDHVRTILAMANRGATLQNLRRFDEALAVMTETVVLEKVKHGPAHPSTLQTVLNIGMTHVSAKRPAKGLPFLEEAVNGFEVSMGPSHGTTIHAKEVLAEAYMRVNRHRAAVPYAQAVFRHNADAHGAGDARTFPDAMRLMTCWFALKRPAAALETLWAVLADWRDHPNPDVEAAHAFELHARMALAYEELGRKALAADHWLEAASCRDAPSRQARSDLAHFRLRAGTLLHELGRHAEAVPILQRAIDARFDLGDNDLTTASACFVLGVSCRELGQLDRAERNVNIFLGTLQEGINAGVIDLRGDLRAVIPHMVKLYEQKHDAKHAEYWRTFKAPREMAPRPVPAK